MLPVVHLNMKLFPLGLVTLALATCSSCTVPEVGLEHPRAYAEQYGAAVQIARVCIDADGTLSGGYGTGVIVAPHYVLTERHVVTCGDGEHGASFVNAGDGKELDSTVEVELPIIDVVRLYVADDLSRYYTPVEIGPTPTLGERVCWSAMVPRPTFRCGTAQAPSTEGIAVDGFVEHGNSGAGLYDPAGRLVGLMHATLPCQTGVYCLGWASPLAGYEWLVNP